MMSKLSAPNLVIIDVGHGSASVLQDRSGVVVFDTGKGPALLEFLRESGITEVKRLVLSHADDDHIGNASRLLLDDNIRIGEVYYNSDPTKATDSQQQLQIAILTARRKKRTEAHPGLSSTLSGTLDCGEVSIEVLFPPPEALVTGVGGRSATGRRNTSNALSAAIRLCHKGKPVVLLGGDVGMECLKFWDEEKIEPIAQIVVFPHHGGAPGAVDAALFAEGVSMRVKPELVVFSIHRSRFNLPREDVVQGILKICPGAKFLCTQLPERIATELKVKRSAWSLHALKSKGRVSWWDGTIEVIFDKGTGKARRYRSNSKLRGKGRKL
jgi:beta-lactamase superfamily II metal-dependent hydrolase